MHDKAPLNVALASMRKCPVFTAACAAVAAAALPGVRTPFSRKAVQSSLWHDNVSGIYFLLGPQRGPLSHYFAAQEVESPRKMSAHALASDLDGVVREIAAQVKAGSDLQAWRKAEQAAMDVVFASLDGWNAKLRDAMPPSAREVGGSIQPANVACCVQALEWPHKDLPLCPMGGFDIVGTLSPSGFFPAAKREAIE